MKRSKRAKGHMVLVGFLLIITIFFLEDCSSGGNGENKGGNTCAAPSLIENWENTYYHFNAQENGDPLIVISDGQSVIAGGIYHDDQGSPFPMALTGPVVSESNGDLTDGTIDWNWNGAIEDNERIGVLEGNLNISANTMKVYDLVIEGNPVEDIVGNCVERGNTTPQLSSVVAQVAVLYDQTTNPQEPFSCSGPGWDTDFDKAVYEFKDPIRIGDDKNYNDHHDPDFKISSPSGKSYSKSFEVSSDCHFSKANIQYTVAGAHEAAKVYLNGSLVGRMHNPGNTATSIASGSIDITSKLRTGSNTIKVSAVLYPGDEINPYDDIEIYNLRITLTR